MFKQINKECEVNIRSKYEKFFSFSCIGKFNTIKIPILPKVIYKFNTVLTKFPVEVFTEPVRMIFNYQDINPERLNQSGTIK